MLHLPELRGGIVNVHVPTKVVRIPVGFAPEANVDRFSAAIAQAVRSPEVAAKLASLNMEAVGSTPEELSRVVAADWAKWGAIVKASGFTLE